MTPRWRAIYAEGRCAGCGTRVTLTHGDDHHLRDGERCGPVATHKPSESSNDKSADHWKVPPR